MPKTDAWRKRQAEKSWGTKFMEFVKEPRYKFYVKEGRTFTIRSGVPGVWEEVAKKIQEQTIMEAEGKETGVRGGRRSLVPARPVKTDSDTRRPKVASLRRQTSRTQSR
jgi:hypothetical protein